MKGRIETDVAAGFAGEQEIVGGAVDVCSAEADADLLRPAARPRLRVNSRR